MKATYDQMYPRMLGKILSKMDPSVKMETKALVDHKGREFFDHPSAGKSNPENIEDMLIKFITFPITDKIREAVKGGQPLFSNARPSGVPGTMFRDADSKSAMDRALKTANKYDPD